MNTDSTKKRSVMKDNVQGPLEFAYHDKNLPEVQATTQRLPDNSFFSRQPAYKLGTAEIQRKPDEATSTHH